MERERKWLWLIGFTAVMTGAILLNRLRPKSAAKAKRLQPFKSQGSLVYDSKGRLEGSAKVIKGRAPVRTAPIYRAQAAVKRPEPPKPQPRLIAETPLIKPARRHGSRLLESIILGDDRM